MSFWCIGFSALQIVTITKIKYSTLHQMKTVFFLRADDTFTFSENKIKNAQNYSIHFMHIINRTAA